LPVRQSVLTVTNATGNSVLVRQTNLDLRFNPRLRINYVGDAARVTLNGKLLDDQFYNGGTFEIGLKRYLPEILTGDLQLQILPLRRDAPIYLTDAARRALGKSACEAKVESIQIVLDNRAEFDLFAP